MCIQAFQHLEALAWKCSVKNVFLKNYRNSQENTLVAHRYHVDFCAQKLKVNVFLSSDQEAVEQ